MRCHFIKLRDSQIQMKKYLQAVAVLLLTTLPVICHADPLNGGLGNAFKILLALLIVGIVLIIASLIVSIYSIKSRKSAPHTGAWVLVIITNILALPFQYGFGQMYSAFRLIGTLPTVSLLILLTASLRYASGSKFVILFILRAIAGIFFLSNLTFILTTNGYYIFANTALNFTVHLILFIALATWCVLELLRLSAKKEVPLTGQLQSIKWGIVICIGVYFLNSVHTYFFNGFFRDFTDINIPSTIIGVFPYNVIQLLAYTLPGAIAYKLYTTRSRAA